MNLNALPVAGIEKGKTVLVTGATGYVGGRLVPRLLEAGYRVRCLARDPIRLQGRPWLDRVEVIQGDAVRFESLVAAMQGVSAAYYLIHGMQGGQVNAERDMTAARNFANAAEQAGIERIIYLGELVDPTARLSPYLRSRHESGYILRQGRVPVTEFRAGMIIGSGSVLFEMVRYIAERQLLLVCPRWFFSHSQPIAIRNVLDYLVAALVTPESAGKLIEIGGASRLRYSEMLQAYARERGLHRLLIPTPFYLPRASAYWVHMVTPLTYHTILPLIEGLHANLVVHDDEARKLFPGVGLLDFQTALQLAIGRIETHNVETSWSDALVTSAGDIKPYQFTVEEGMFVEHRQRLVSLPPEYVYRSYTGVGGKRGWLYMDWAWALRGWLDKLVGGVGLRRGRRDSDDIRTGESLDFWRVEMVNPGHQMRLYAEMKLPGKAWLEFQSIPQENNQTLLTTTAYFDPHGVLGFLYWYAMWPFHKFIFDGLTRRIAERAQALAASPINAQGVEDNNNP
jgi:uncharacterized protein YbjT (DUF2867 family)